MNFYQQPFGFFPQPLMQPGFAGQQPFIQPGFAGQQPFMQPGFGQQPFVQPGFIGQPTLQQPGFFQQPFIPGETLSPLMEQSFIENILRLNVGKVATIYMSFEGSQWGSKIFKGYVLAAGRDHIVLKDLQSELRYILPMIYLSYITFDEVIDYEYPFRKDEKNP